MVVDDCLIFTVLEKKTERNIRYIVDHYYRVSRKLVNYHKSKSKAFERQK